MNKFYPGLFCAFLIGVLVWAVDPSAPLESLNPDPANSYFNRLVEGFNSGHIYMNVQPPDGFADLKDPYEPGLYVTTFNDLVDLSYYHGKFFLYFGVTPAITLFWPASLLGIYVSDRCAVALFFALAFFVMWSLLLAIRQRYFPEVSAATLQPAIFIFGLILGLNQFGMYYNVVPVSALAFSMLALGGIWKALHDSAVAWRWLAFSSLCYGLAVGARPSLLFGAIILFIPLVQSKNIKLLIPTALPIVLIGIGLMIYNDLRFDSPFEFGRHYQLTRDYRSTTAHQLSIHFFSTNFQYYFLNAFRWTAHFPFVDGVNISKLPKGYSTDPESNFGSVSFQYPFVLFAIFVPAFLKLKSPLHWFILALVLLFSAGAIFDCFLMVASLRYTLDFLPFLMLLAFIGFMKVATKHRLLVLVWYLFLAFSLVFNSLANIKTQAFENYFAGGKLLDEGRAEEALNYLQMATSLDPCCSIYHDQLSVAYESIGQTESELSELQKTLAIDPNYIDAKYRYGTILFEMGKTNECYKNFEALLDLAPVETNPNYAKANILAAEEIVSQNPSLAVKLAECACKETSYGHADSLLVASTIYSKAGQSEKAISIVQQGITLAQRNGQVNLLKIGESLLTSYQKHQRQTTPDNPPLKSRKEERVNQ